MDIRENIDFKTISQKLMQNAGYSKSPQFVILGESTRPYWEEQCGKERIQQLTDEGHIKWV